MTVFESELYRDPTQDLNGLWWQLVQKYQKINPPKNRENKSDWAAKYHIGLAPVYYFSYLLGEFFASSIQETLKVSCGTPSFATPISGKFLQDKLFYPGNRMNWAELVKHVTGSPISYHAWVAEFC
jgi:peptidyl-dipeptidase A